jgi:biotin transport system substrate-specific component
MSRNSTLASAALGDLSVLKQTALVLAGSLLIAIAAQVSIPMFPVPMTLQTLAILTVGFALGARLGAATLLVYLAEGAMGLPVFANGHAGLPYMMGPTGGFLLGFVAMAWLAGWAADRGLARRVAPAIAVGLVAALVIYIPGLIWPSIVLGTEWSALWAGWMAPFLLGDVVKAVIAALAVSGGLAALRSRA